MESTYKSIEKWADTEEIQLANKCLKRYSNSLKITPVFKMRIVFLQNYKKLISCNEVRLWGNIHSVSPHTE